MRSTSEEAFLPDGWMRREGFTLIELLVVTLIVGILAAVMIPRMDDARDRSYFSSIASDLRNMGASQERYHQTNFQYSVALAQLDFSPTAGVTMEVTEASTQGCAGVAWHQALGDTREGAPSTSEPPRPLPSPVGPLTPRGPGAVQCTN